MKSQARAILSRAMIFAFSYTIGGLSAHADQKALLDWLGHFEAPPAKTLVVHGELSSTPVMAEAIRETLRWQNVTVPTQKTVIHL